MKYLLDGTCDEALLLHLATPCCASMCWLTHSKKQCSVVSISNDVTLLQIYL